MKRGETYLGLWGRSVDQAGEAHARILAPPELELETGLAAPVPPAVELEPALGLDTFAEAEVAE